MPNDEQPAKPEKDIPASYMAMVGNAVGSQQFRNFYIKTPEGATVDALNDGADSCAFFVSSLLLVFGQVATAHATVTSTVADMLDHGWASTPEMQAGDVIVWEAIPESDGSEHIGFYIGDGLAISMSSQAKAVARHDIHFGDLDRPIKTVLRSSITG